MLIDVYGDQINKRWSSYEDGSINGFSGNRRGYNYIKGGDSGGTISL